jgi:hypothetical protein
MAFQYAGFYQNGLADQNGRPVSSLSINVYNYNTTVLASLYTDQTMATALGNPITTDVYGNFFFYAVPGQYTLAYTINGVALTKNIEVNTWYDELVPPGGGLYATTQTVINSGTFSQILNLATNWSQGGMTVANNALTIPVAGVYSIDAFCQWQNSNGAVAAGDYYLGLYKNGAQKVVTETRATDSSNNPCNMISVTIPLAVNDVLTIWGYQNSGGTQGINDVGPYAAYLNATKVG